MKGLTAKNIWDFSRNNVFAIITVVVALGVTTYYRIKPATLNDVPHILSLVLLILVLIVISGFQQLSQLQKSIDRTRKANISQVFTEELKIDLSKIKSDIIITGIALMDSLNQIRDDLTECLNRGIRISIIIIESKDELLEELHNKHETHTLEYRREELRAARAILRNIIAGSDRPSDASIKIGYLPYLPSYALTLLDHDLSSGSCRVKVYTHKFAKKPAFNLTRQNDPEWYDFFIRQYELLKKSCRHDVITKDSL